MIQLLNSLARVLVIWKVNRDRGDDPVDQIVAIGHKAKHNPRGLLDDVARMWLIVAGLILAGLTTFLLFVNWVTTRG